MNRLMAQVDDKDLERGHRAARSVVQGLITLSLLLVALAFAGVGFALPPSLINQYLFGSLWIVILCLALGAVILRRTRFNATRLQDVAAVRGQAGLIDSLRKTTTLVALVGGVIAVIGFAAYLISLVKWDMLRAGVVALAVLLYCYPRRAAWRRVVEASQQPGGIPGPSPAKGTAP
jgi:hypothetical protein